MSHYFITFRSVTFAQVGERLLQKNGVACVLSRTPRRMEEQGCGYCLRVKKLRPALMLLREHQVGYRKIYYQSSAGEMEEVVI